MLKRRLFSSMPSIGRGGMIVSSLLLLVVLSLTLAACASPTSASIPTITPTPAKTVAPASTSTPIATPTVAPAPTPTPKATSTVAPAAKPSGLIEQKWIEPQVNGETLSIPVSVLETDWNTRFKVQTASGEITGMAYILDGKTYVRANVCPPCRSVGFRLSGNTLICMSCGTKFNATTGEGISGACVSYPKAAVNYQVTGGNVVLSKADLSTAYQNTMKPGLP